MQLFQAQIFQFRQAQAGSVSQFQHGLVAQTFAASLGSPVRAVLSISSFDQRFRQSFPTARQRKIFRRHWSGSNFSFSANRKTPAARRSPDKRSRCSASVEDSFGSLDEGRPLAFVLQERHEMLQLDRFPIREILFRRPRGEFAEQRGVSFCRVAPTARAHAAGIAENLRRAFAWLKFSDEKRPPPPSQNVLIVTAAVQQSEQTSASPGTLTTSISSHAHGSNLLGPAQTANKKWLGLLAAVRTAVGTKKKRRRLFTSAPFNPRPAPGVPEIISCLS